MEANPSDTADKAKEADKDKEPEPFVPIKKKDHIFTTENDINLSDIDDEDQKKELLDLELQIDNEALTRGERRRL